MGGYELGRGQLWSGIRVRILKEGETLRGGSVWRARWGGGVSGSDLWDERVWGRAMGSQERDCEWKPFRPALRSSPTSGALGSGAPV